MKFLSVTSIMTILLLVGCATTRSTGKETAVCDCEKATQVPDKAFRNFLVDREYAVRAGWHSLKPTSKGCELKAMECYEQGIKSLEGIEMFPQLEQVTCSDNPITDLNLNGLPNLRRLYALNLNLRSIHLEQCRHLWLIELSHNELDTFDLTPFPELTEFFCIFSPLRNIDLSPCPDLKFLYIRGTQIRSVDLTPCRNFNALHALDSPLKTIIVSHDQYQSDIKASVEDSVQVVVRSGATGE